MGRFCIDRFEGELAVCEAEDGSFVTIAKSLLPPQAREGDCLLEENGQLLPDPAETQRRRSQVAERLRRLRGNQS